MGDALAVVLTQARNFQPEDFARFHPGGSLGRKLLTLVRDVMHKENLPVCSPQATFKDVVSIINRGRLGIALVMGDEEQVGLITDGDIRRFFDLNCKVSDIMAKDLMTKNPKKININMRFSEAEEMMKKNKINSLIVTDNKDKVVGIVQIYDIN
jgi:arabinose-5-phosphate isomerase